MVLGEQVAPALLEGRRHGVLMELTNGDVLPMSARTRRRARRTWEQLYAANAVPWHGVVVSAEGDSRTVRRRPGLVVALYRVERRRVVEEWHEPAPDDLPPDARVREPRRPYPSAGGAAAAAPLPEDE